MLIRQSSIWESDVIIFKANLALEDTSESLLTVQFGPQWVDNILLDFCP